MKLHVVFDEINKPPNSEGNHVQKVNIFRYELTLSQTSPGFYVCAVQVFWKLYGKRRNCS